MPSAATKRRGAFLNCRFAVNGIQKASRLLAERFVVTGRFMPGPPRLAPPTPEDPGGLTPAGLFILRENGENSDQLVNRR